MADESKGLRDLTDAASLATKRKALENYRTEDIRDWILNREFYRGNQYSFFNRISNRVESLPVDEGDKPRFKVRLVSNQIAPGVNHWVAQLTKNKPVIHASPDSSSDRDIKSAQVAEQVYEHLWRPDQLALGAKLQSALMHAAISQGYWLITWDPLAGVPITSVTNPQTGEIIDGPLADMMMEETQKLADEHGVDASLIRAEFTKTVYEGEVKVEALPGQNVLLDPSAMVFEDANYAIVTHNMDPDEVSARYGVKVTADGVPSDGGPAVAFTKPRADSRPKTTKAVYCMYIRPNPALPKGRYVEWVEDPNKILVDGPWPFPFKELPLVKFPGLERTDSVLDIPPTSLARSTQKELNRTISQIVEHKNLTIKPQMVAPVGSLRQRLTAEPGAVFEYQPIAGLAPEWRPPQNLPSYVFEQLADLQQRLDKVFNRLPSQRDSLPARIDSPGSIDLIHEAVADQLSPIVLRLEDALARAGTLIVKLAHKYYTEPRTMKVMGSNGSEQAKKFRASSDLDGGFSFHAEAGSGLPRTRGGKQSLILDLFDKQIIDPSTALKYLDLAGMDSIKAKMAADEDQALREHDKLIRGEPISDYNMQQAQQQIQQLASQPGPDGQPLPPEQLQAQAQQILQQASVQPLPFENADSHLDTHGLYMKSSEYEALPDDAKQRFIDHWSATLQMSISIHKATMALDPKIAPKVTAQLKGTMSAPVLSDILQHSGIETNEQEVAELPLDTWVTEDLSKPNADASGNSPMDEAAQVQQLTQASDQHALKQAKAAHEVTLAHQQQTKNEQAMAHAEELHAARLRQMEAQRQQAGKPKSG